MKYHTAEALQLDHMEGNQMKVQTQYKCKKIRDVNEAARASVSDMFRIGMF